VPSSQKTIGVLALQGSFAEHLKMIEKIGAKGTQIRSLADTKDIDALILPGGESTVMMKLLKKTGLDEWIKKQAKAGLPIYGTCAGMILLSKSHLDLMDIEVDRNAYGPQLASFEDEIELSPTMSSSRRRGSKSMTSAIFIRAPKITHRGKGVKVLATHKKTPVLVQQGNLIAGSFHPELSRHEEIYEYLLNMLH
jgi:pyridoxal 5'-phosphate synthase pdxT subunit